MYRKILCIILSALVLILISSVCLATDGNQSFTNTVRNTMDNAENAVEGAAKNVGNNLKDGAENIGNTMQGAATTVGNAITDTVQNAGNAVKGAAENAGNEVKNSIEKTGNSIQNGVNSVNNAMSNNNVDTNNNSDYTASRTSADNTTMGMNNTAWTWIIIAAAGIAIVALVWYYSTQVDSKHYDDK